MSRMSSLRYEQDVTVEIYNSGTRLEIETFSKTRNLKTDQIIQIYLIEVIDGFKVWEGKYSLEEKSTIKTELY